MFGLGYARGDDFVHVQGAQFVLHGKPFYVTGVNNHYLTFGSETEVTRVLDDAVAMGANVVRMILGPVIGAPDGTKPRTIWKFNNPSADSSNLNVHGDYELYWNPATDAMGINAGVNGIQRLDFVVAGAAKRHLKLIVCLLDFWSYTGGAKQMCAWYGSTDADSFFFSDPRTRADYRKWAQFVLDRINPLTGVAYRNDPTIFAWELMNEPQGALALRNRWLSDMSAYVKKLDSNHLVSTGEAYLNKADFAIPTIDFVTWHGYPLYYGITPRQFNRLIGANCALAQKYNKPVLLEEFGYARSNTNPTRAQAYGQWTRTLAANPSCAGWVYWRLVSRQDNGQYPPDNYDQFDIHKDGSEAWRVLSAAAHAGRSLVTRGTN